MPLDWDVALDLLAAELGRVRDSHGPSAIYGGSYGWASAGRFHHAQSQLKRFLSLAGGFTSSVNNYSYGASQPFLPRVLAGEHVWDSLATQLADDRRAHRAIRRFRWPAADVDPLVVLTNEIVRGWPAGRSLDLVHAPFAAANVPATTDRAFYAPQAQLQLPDKVRFAAGFAHEAQPQGDQKSIRSIIDGHLGREVEIAAACGLGRRTPEGGRAVLERIAALCV